MGVEHGDGETGGKGRNLYDKNVSWKIMQII